MASLTQWTWVWADSGSWWWTGRLGVLQFMGSQRVGHDWVTELNWTTSNHRKRLLHKILLIPVVFFFLKKQHTYHYHRDKPSLDADFQDGRVEESCVYLLSYTPKSEPTAEQPLIDKDWDRPKIFCISKDIKKKPRDSRMGVLLWFGQIPYPSSGWRTNWRRILFRDSPSRVRIWVPYQAPQPRALASGGAPGVFGFDCQWGLISGSPWTWGSCGERRRPLFILKRSQQKLMCTETKGINSDFTAAWTWGISWAGRGCLRLTLQSETLLLDTSGSPGLSLKQTSHLGHYYHNLVPRNNFHCFI